MLVFSGEAECPAHTVAVVQILDNPSLGGGFVYPTGERHNIRCASFDADLEFVGVGGGGFSARPAHKPLFTIRIIVIQILDKGIRTGLAL